LEGDGSATAAITTTTRAPLTSSIDYYYYYYYYYHRYRAPDVPWTEKFNHVVGVCHTNYLVYSTSTQGGQMKAAFLFFLNQWMCRAYCHKVSGGEGMMVVVAIGGEGEAEGGTEGGG